jgi:hypothetical protein
MKSSPACPSVAFVSMNGDIATARTIVAAMVQINPLTTARPTRSSEPEPVEATALLTSRL